MSIGLFIFADLTQKLHNRRVGLVLSGDDQRILEEGVAKPLFWVRALYDFQKDLNLLLNLGRDVTP
jgi:hypothetical protein